MKLQKKKKVKTPAFVLLPSRTIKCHLNPYFF